jgi:hypothetical protein
VPAFYKKWKRKIPVKTFQTVISNLFKFVILSVLSDQLISRDEAIQLWIYIIRYGLADVLQAPSIPPLKAEACAALATVGSQIFECLPVCYFKNKFKSTFILNHPFLARIENPFCHPGPGLCRGY